MEENFNFDDEIANMNSGYWNFSYNPYTSIQPAMYPVNNVPTTNSMALNHVEINNLRVEIDLLRTEVNELKKKLGNTAGIELLEHRKLDIDIN